MKEERPTGSSAGRRVEDAPERRLADIRASVAEVAQKAADAALGRVIDALARYDAQLGLEAAAEAAWDPGSVRVSKDKAQQAFRSMVSRAPDRFAIEAAARVWLDEINRINARVRDAQMRIRRERDAAAELLAEIDRLCIEAGASRSRADTAVEACRTALRALEAQAEGRPSGWGATLTRARTSIVPGAAAASDATEPRSGQDPTVAALEAVASGASEEEPAGGAKDAVVERRAARSTTRASAAQAAASPGSSTTAPAPA